MLLKNFITQFSILLKRAKTFLITGHDRPDGDTIGSALALASFLKGKGKTVKILFKDKIPEHFLFLPHAESIEKGVIKGDYNVAIFLECPKIEEKKRFKKIINIDHHLNVEQFGDYNVIDPKAAACGEIVYKIINSINKKLTKEEATCLYVALLTDTGNFQWNTTTSKTLEIASELIKWGAHPYSIYRNLHITKSIQTIKKIGKLLSNTKHVLNNKVTYVELEKDIKDIDTNDVINYIGMIKGTKIFLMFRKLKKNLTKVSFRSHGDIDVNKIAVQFGGGGHKYASGCIIKKDIESVKKEILNVLRKVFK